MVFDLMGIADETVSKAQTRTLKLSRELKEVIDVNEIFFQQNLY